MKPYYSESGIEIYCGDCRDAFGGHWLSDYDVVITDPPYGIKLGSSDSRGAGHGLAYAAYESFSDTHEAWSALVPGVITKALLGAARERGAVFPGKHVTELPAPSVVGGVYVPSGTGRNQWGFTNLMTVFFYGVNPKISKGAHQTVLRSAETAEINGHPCPKPIGWMRWLVEFATEPNEVVLDPFMGSGTTLVAAKQLGRRAIGIELEEKYCEIAAKRLSQGALPLEMGA